MKGDGKGDGSPFEFTPNPGEDARHGVLCIHGFTGTPFAMRYLGQHLGHRGFHVLGPVLAGHGTTLEALSRSTWQDWYASVEAAFDQLASRCERVAVVGQSLGGLLALHLARHRAREITAIAALATPLWLSSLAHWVVRHTGPGSLGRRLIPRLPKLGGSDIRDPAMKKQIPSLPAIPTPALHQLVEFMEIVRGELPDITVPTTIIHSEKDHTAPYACSLEIADKLAGSPVAHHPLHESYHLIAIDTERDFVADTVGDFFDDCFADRSARTVGGDTADHEPGSGPE